MNQTLETPLVDEAPLNDLKFQLLNEFQRGFPLVSQPFLALAQRLAVDEAAVIAQFQTLLHRGVISRIGAVFRPNVVGASALAALAVPIDRLEEVANLVNQMEEVNHNYQREHRFNLWFVATAESADLLCRVFEKIESMCGCGAVLVLPLLEQFHIDLGFGLGVNETPYFQHGAQTSDVVASVALSGAERKFMAHLQTGLPLVSRPYADLGWKEDDAIDLLKRWTTAGVIKRFGVVVRHQELGYHANAMVVWNVPDAEVSGKGKIIGSSGRVSLCYRRPRKLPDWPFNLFCMIHGKDRADVEQRIAALIESCGMQAYSHAILFSTRRFKQCGARYVVDYGSH